jgi:hypothetical protein
MQRSIGNRATTRQLQRYKILGPWNTGQAVHETLTVLAVGEAIHELEADGIDPGELMAGFDVDKLPDLGKTASFDPVDAPASFQQFIRGVVWADDPKGLLFDKDEDATDYSSGAMWYSEFGEGEKGKFAADKSDLISRRRRRVPRLRRPGRARARQVRLLRQGRDAPREHRPDQGRRVGAAALHAGAEVDRPAAEHRRHRQVPRRDGVQAGRLDARGRGGDRARQEAEGHGAAREDGPGQDLVSARQLTTHNH